MPTPMDHFAKRDLLAAIRADRERFERIIDAVPSALRRAPILPGGWSVKDVLAHIAWGEREAIGVLRARALDVASELWDLPEDERNDIVVRRSRSRTLEEILVDYQTAFGEYVGAIEEVSDEELNEPSRFRGLTERIPGWRPWRVVYDPGHYDEHLRVIASAMTAAGQGRS